MFRSLRYKFIFTIVMVSTIAVAAVGLFSSRVISVQLDRFLSNDEQTSLQNFRLILERHYRQRHGDWNEVAPLLESIAAGSGKRLILLGANRSVIAAAPAAFNQGNIEIDEDYTFRWRQEQIVNQVDNGTIGSEKQSVYQYEIAKVPHELLTDETGNSIGMLCLIPTVEFSPTVANVIQITDSINQALFIAAFISSVIAAFFAVLLARRVLHPIETLTIAARRMEIGNFNPQVEIDSKDEIGDLARAFNSMAKNLTLFERQRREMLSDISHELRTPLAVIRCQIEAVRDKLENPTAEVIESLYEEVLLVARLMDDLQDAALAETSGLRLDKEYFALNDEIERATGAFRRAAAEKHLTIVADLRAEIPAIYGDRQRIGQALRNLLQNAIKYTPPFSGNITVASILKKDSVEITITDRGIGIAAEHLPFVFDRFYRADPSRARSTGGSGLGLTIVKQIAEAHGGRVEIKSPASGEGGARVCFTIPLQSKSLTE